MTLEKKIALADVFKIAALVFMAGVAYADSAQSHKEIAALSVKVDSMSSIIQGLLVSNQKLSDALDHLQNPNLPGPVRPVRYYYAPPTSHGRQPLPAREDVLNGN